MYCQFSRHNAARGSSTGLVTVGPAKVQACYSILFTEGVPEVGIKNDSGLLWDLSYHKNKLKSSK